MALQQPDRLKSQLLNTGLQQKDPALYQIINSLIDIIRAANIEITAVSESSGGGSADAITELTTDVVAVGPGAVPATIQPLAVTTAKIDNLAVTTGKIADDAVTTVKILDANVTTPKIADDAVTTAKILNDNVTTAKIADNAVTYAKMQQVSDTEKLLGNGDISAPANVQEIGLGDNLEIQDDTLQIYVDDGSGGTTVGLAHKVLSPTHSDSLPADAVLGDLIVADNGGDLPGTYAGFFLSSAVVEDFEGIRYGYMRGFNGNELNSGNQLWGAPPPLEYIDAPQPDTWLTWNLIDFFAQASVVEDFEGIRFNMIGETPGGFPYITGNNFACAASLLAMVPAPDLANPTYGTLWQRLAVGITGQVIQPIDGVPGWTSDLELAGSAQIDGDLNIDGDVDIQGDLDALNASVTVQNLTGLGTVGAPQGDFGTLEVNDRAVGLWVDVAFAAGNFTANGGTTPTWTLTAPDQVLFRYCYIGYNLMKIQVYLATTTVASVAGAVTELRILIPDSRVPVGTPAHLVGAQEAGAAVFDVYATTDPAIGNYILVRTFPLGGGRAFNQTANASYFAFTIDIRTT
jgi:hypothetical protein